MLLALRVSSKARKTPIEELHDVGTLKMRDADPSVDGKANAQIVRFISELLKVLRFQVSILKGAAGCDKAAHLQGIELKEARDKPAPLTG